VRQLARQLACRFQRLPDRNHAVGQPHRQRLLRAHRPAGQDQIERAREPDQARQSYGAAVDERHPPAPAEHAENRILLDHAQIAPQCQLQSARHRVARNRRDDRFSEQHPRRSHRAVSVGRDAIAPVRRGECLQVGACAEDAMLAVQHGHARGLVLVERAEGVGQSDRGLAIDCIAGLAPVEHHRRHRSLLLNANRHDVTSLQRWESIIAQSDPAARAHPIE